MLAEVKIRRDAAIKALKLIAALRAEIFFVSKRKSFLSTYLHSVLA